MISCDYFSIATAPRTASAWLMRACSLSGLTLVGDDVHAPPPPNYKKWSLSIVRNPLDWLVSFHQSAHHYTRDKTAPYDSILELTKQHRELDSFLRAYATSHAGAVTKMFDAYATSTVIRIEDLPYSAISFLDPFALICPSIISMRPVNYHFGASDNPFVLAKHARHVIDAERDFCRRYDYA